MTWKRFHFPNPPFPHFLIYVTWSQRLPQPLETQNKSSSLLFFAFFISLFRKKHYICTMKELLETIPRIELALIIIGVFALMLGILFGYVMIHEYRMYLEDHWKARFSFRDFFKQEQFYIFLFLASIFIMLLNLLYFLEWVSARMN